MPKEDLEARMRSLECFHALRMSPGAWAIIRLNGRGFRHFTEHRFEKPFDPKFRNLMAGTARALLEDLQAIYAYTMSDEISVLLAPDWDLFDRRVEKVVSISAGCASAAFTRACGEPAHFDSRIWLASEDDLVVDYFLWRQSDAARNALNGWCYWILRRDGRGVEEATRDLRGKTVTFKKRMLREHGIEFKELPAWQVRGVGLYWEEYEKVGYDPKEKREVVATRRRIKTDEKLPEKDDYARLIRSIMSGR
jgi:tRNA(His) 5'-end guanylyltransferase